jgi:glycosyltransferase involved in cell wall biosynthesis
MKRILCVLPIPYHHDWNFWIRDAGLTVLTLREMGYDAWLVVLGDATTDTSNRPVMAVSVEDLRQPEWWKKQRPDAVVLSTGSGPRYDAVRKGALSATPRVVERLDTDGGRSYRLYPRENFITSTGSYLDCLPAPIRWLAPAVAAVRTALLYTFPALLDVRMVETMRQLPAVMAESPMAVERMQKMFETFSGKKHRVAMIPHPVNEDVLRFDDSPRMNQVISVGRWESYQKDYPMLRKVLQGFLERHPDWTAVVVGSGAPEADSASSNQREEWLKQVTFHSRLSHEKLALEYNCSKIYLMVSRHESFCIAAAEALCCGCSVVGSSAVPTSHFFAQAQSGRVATPRSSAAFLKALDEEVISWSDGERMPKLIASAYRAQTGTHAVAAAIVSLLEETPA